MKPMPSLREPSEQHRRQMLWQVWIPLVVTVLLFIFLAAITIGAAVGPGEGVEVWSGISVIFLGLPVLLMGIFSLAILGTLAYFLPKAIRKLPGFGLLARVKLYEINSVIQDYATRAATPLIKVRGGWAGWQYLKSKMTGRHGPAHNQQPPKTS